MTKGRVPAQADDALPGPAPRRPTYVLEPSRVGPTLGLSELIRYRDLVYLLARRDITIRYNRTAIGVAWVILQPVLQAVVFGFVFGRAAGMPSEGVPYVLFVFAALLPWQTFSSGVVRATASVVAGEALIKKVFFPRIVLPLACVLASLFDLAITLALFLASLVLLGRWPGAALAYLPLGLVAAAVATMGFAAGLSALNVRYRDVTYVVPYVIQLGLFVTPIAYPVAIVPDQWKWLYSLNPLVAVIETFRVALLGLPGPGAQVILISVASLVATSVVGVTYFKLLERDLADEV